MKMLNLISSKCLTNLILVIYNLLVAGCLKIFYNLIKICIDEIQNNEPGVKEADLEKHFSKWFKEYVNNEIFAINTKFITYI